VEDPSFPRLQGVRDIGGMARNTDEHGSSSAASRRLGIFSPKAGSQSPYTSGKL
jgi:hypothetical protein